MRRIPASFLRALEPSRSQRTCERSVQGPRRRVTSGLFALALVTLAGLLVPVGGAAAAQAPASITNATTGLSDATSVAPVAACEPSTAFRATCLAQILGVRGTKALVHPRLRRPSSIYRFTRPRPRHGHTSTPAVAAATAPQPGTPAYLQQAYDLAYLSQNAGAGQTIAIVDAYDDPNAESDLAAYRSEFGLPPCTSANGCFAKYNQTGGTNYPTTVDSGWELEISLDLDAVSALCPNCNIDLIEANTDGTSDLAAAQLEAGMLAPSVITDSWDVALSGGQARNFPTTGDYTFPGITTVAASGDSGYPGAFTNDFPAALPGVTAAGGTRLQPDSTSGVQNVRGFTESAWSGTGSGCNLGASKPSYQTDTGCTGRSYSDISADGDPDTGMQVYDTDDGGWVVVGGTSEASPLIAAYYAIVGSASQGPAWAYSNASLLNDPTSGSNGTCLATISYICNAGPGYDGPTGIGSISGAVVSGAPGIAGPGANGSYTQTVTSGSAELQGAVYPNGADTTYWWEYGTTSAYGQTTTPNDIGSGTAAVPVSDSLGGLSPGATYHYRLVAREQRRHRVRVRLHVHHAGLDAELTGPLESEPDDDHHAVAADDYDHAFAADRVRRLRNLGDHTGQRPGGERRSRRRGRDDCDGERDDRHRRSGDHVHASVRDDPVARQGLLELAVLAGNRSGTLDAPEPVPRQDLLLPRRGEQRRRKQHRRRRSASGPRP